MLWVWPEPVPFRLGQQTPRVAWAIAALDRLRKIELQPGEPPKPILIPLAFDARDLLEQFARQMQQRQREAGPLFASAVAKARGQVVCSGVAVVVCRRRVLAAAEVDQPPRIRFGGRADARIFRADGRTSLRRARGDNLGPQCRDPRPLDPVLVRARGACSPSAARGAPNRITQSRPDRTSGSGPYRSLLAVAIRAAGGFWTAASACLPGEPAAPFAAIPSVTLP